MMRTETPRFRWLAERLPGADQRRVVVVLGARQVGKTTLGRRCFPTLKYLSLDAVEDREALRALHTASWARVVGPAVLDEAQKEPSVFDKVKYAYDAGDIDFSVILGSSRLLLLERVRESLAGRTFLYDLWPLMASELRTAEDERAEEPLVARLLEGEGPVGDVLAWEAPSLLGRDEALRRESWDHLATWGGMPELLRLDDASRREWLRSYPQSWVEHDLGDMARLSDLQAFRTLHRLALLRTGQLLVYSELARDAGVSATTARRYLEYLRISFQVVLLEPWSTNLTSSAVKAQKLYPLDIGLLRAGTGRWGALDGPAFEALVVGELHKWVSTRGVEARLSFYRTRSGMEVDILVETPSGVWGVEVKQRASAATRDTSGLRAVGAALGERWRGGLVVTDGGRVTELGSGLWGVPAHRLF